MTKKEKIKEVLERGVEEIIDKKNLERKLSSGKKLRIKYGIDPTGPKIHIGRAIPLWKLKQFQDLGYKIVLIIGDFTAQIGDASDKDAMRKPLTEKEVKKNMKDYKKQISKILDIKKVEFRNNSEWLSKLTAKDLMSLEMNFTAQQLIQRRNFKERWEKGKAIGSHELNYPLLQGYDSVAVKADVEIGGFDQLFNLETGREVQKIFRQKPQDIMATKMLYGLDGRKMSTSWGNIITIVDNPNEMFGKIMSMQDKLVPNYFELCTRLPLAEINKIEKGLKTKEMNPRDAKTILAKEIVTMYYSKAAAEKAEKEFEKVFKKKEVPSNIPIFVVVQKTYPPLDLLFALKLASSKKEAKRVILQGGVKIIQETRDKKQNTKIVKDWREPIEIKDGMIMQVGRRKFAKIKKA